VSRFKPFGCGSQERVSNGGFRLDPPWAVWVLAVFPALALFGSIDSLVSGEFRWSGIGDFVSSMLLVSLLLWMAGGLWVCGRAGRVVAVVLVTARIGIELLL